MELRVEAAIQSRRAIWMTIFLVALHLVRRLHLIASEDR